MRSIRLAACLMVPAVLLSACSESPTQYAENDLEGLWNLPYQETPSIYGLVSAQVIFRPDGTYLFKGHNPLSSGPYGEFTVTGTWSRSASTVVLVAGDDATTWKIEFDDEGGVIFMESEGSSTFRLFRPGPD